MGLNLKWSYATFILYTIIEYNNYNNTKLLKPHKKPLKLKKIAENEDFLKREVKNMIWYDMIFYSGDIKPIQFFTMVSCRGYIMYPYTGMDIKKLNS